MEHTHTHTHPMPKLFTYHAELFWFLLSPLFSPSCIKSIIEHLSMWFFGIWIVWSMETTVLNSLETWFIDTLFKYISESSGGWIFPPMFSPYVEWFTDTPLFHANLLYAHASQSLPRICTVSVMMSEAHDVSLFFVRENSPWGLEKKKSERKGSRASGHSVSQHGGWKLWRGFKILIGVQV